MKTFGTVMTLCLSLLLVAGLVAGVSAQQQPTAPAPTESKDATKDQSPTMSSPQPTPPASERSMTPGAPAPGQPQTPSTSTDKQTNTTVTERTTVEREPARIFGMDATLAMVLGAALLVVIVIGLVAMGRRGETVEHHHHRV
jgi:cytoskeletal protein RodZ